MPTLEEFDRGAIPNAAFHHQDHVRIAFEMLANADFETALARFASRLRMIAATAGHPEKFHMTITVAFMSAISERLARDGAVAWEEFARRNSDLLDRAYVRRLYTAAELESDIARRTFILPRSREAQCAM